MARCRQQDRDRETVDFGRALTFDELSGLRPACCFNNDGLTKLVCAEQRE
jgi:hypothetical protein